MSECSPKEAAAIGALELVSELYGDRPTSIGVGTGSTVGYFIKRGVGLLRSASGVVASSMDTLLALRGEGLIPADVRGAVYPLDLYVDGADEVDSEGNLIKGRGAALLGEKILAYGSRTFIVVVDESKLVSMLGEKKPVPLEVVRDAVSLVVDTLQSLGLRAEPRRGTGKDGPVVSDWGGVIVDVYPGEPIRDPWEFERLLKSIPGVVETGLFLGLADYVVVGLEGCKWRTLRFERRTGMVRARR